MLEFAEGLAYHEESGTIGEVEGINFKHKSVTVNDGEKTQEFPLDEVEYISKLGTLHKDTVYDHDVLQDKSGRLLLMVLNKETGNLRLDLLDNQLNVIETGKSEFAKSEIKELEKYLTIFANYYVLLSSIETVDFNIKVVKDAMGNHYYACNNKDEETVDLIAVVFIGQHLIQEEDYTRQELTYDEYLDFINEEHLVEVSEQQFERYARDVIFGNTNDSIADDDYDEDYEEEYEEDNEYEYDEDYEDEEDDENHEEEFDENMNSINDVIAQHWENVTKAKDNDLKHDEDEDEDEDEEWA